MDSGFFVVVGIILILLAEAMLNITSNKEKYKNYYSLLKLRMVMIYIGEIMSLFGAFSIIASSSISPFEYDETSSFKMFLDFAAWYQISVFVSLKTYDSIQIIPYQKARQLCRVIVPMLEKGEYLEAKQTIEKIQTHLPMPKSMAASFEYFNQLCNALLTKESDDSSQAVGVIEIYILEMESKIEILQSQATGSILLRSLFRFKE